MKLYTILIIFALLVFVVLSCDKSKLPYDQVDMNTPMNIQTIDEAPIDYSVIYEQDGNKYLWDNYYYPTKDHNAIILTKGHYFKQLINGTWDFQYNRDTILDGELITITYLERK